MARPKLLQIIRGAWPKNLSATGMWLLYTVASVVRSFLVGTASNYIRSSQIDLYELIGHGELFAFSVSLVIGSARLFSRDDERERFHGRQICTLIALLLVVASEIGFMVVKATAEKGLYTRQLATVSLWCGVACLLFVTWVVFIDASLTPRSDLERDANKEIEDLSKKLGKLGAR